MESALLGVVLDSSTVITAERKKLPVPQFIEAIQTAYGEIEVSLSKEPVSAPCRGPCVPTMKSSPFPHP